MKKVFWLLLAIIFLFYPSFYPNAKNIAYSLHKYPKEEFTHLEDSYNEKGEKDGILVGGNFQKEDSKEEAEEKVEMILIKYKTSGEKSWIYTYGEEFTTKLLDLDYTYNEGGKIDGYLATIETISDQEEKILFLKIGINGELLSEKESSFPKIKKIIPIIAEEKAEGYLAITSINQESYLIHYDLDGNLLSFKREQNVIYEDIVILSQENQQVDYILLKNDSNQKSILRQNIEEESSTTIIPVLENNTSYLMSEENGFLVYGLTSDVKLEQDAYSYFINKYDKEGNLIWESVGEIPINHQQPISLFMDQGKYFLCYQNQIDKSYEVIILDDEGLLEKKIKKIPNPYYEIEDFMTRDNVLYFAGRIRCLDDDNCDYLENSLFLISDEDKVIELEKKENTNIVLLLSTFIFLLLLMILFTKKRIKMK